VVPAALLLVILMLVRQFIVVGENRRLLTMVAEQALRDPLTGLANRALFQDRLAHAMQLRRRDHRSVALLSLDLDDFKLVNDSYGRRRPADPDRSAAGRLRPDRRHGRAPRR
jgi:PleD family two-component response regulator